jgi:hypothetical protein
MKRFSTTAFACGLAIFAVTALIGIPTAASAAGGAGTSKNTVTCKSGKQVKNMSACKENGGKS